MAAMMGGTMRSPLTGAMFAVELTGNIDMLLPLLAATGAAYAVTVLLLQALDPDREDRAPRPAHHARIRDRSVRADARGRCHGHERRHPAGDMSVDAAVAFFTSDQRRHKSYPVVEADGRLTGMVTRADVLRWRTEGDHQAATLDDVVSDTSVVVAHPDEVLGRVADLMVASISGGCRWSIAPAIAWSAWSRARICCEFVRS